MTKRLAGLLAAAAIVLAACGGSGASQATGPTKADRDKLVGTWSGSYKCEFTDAFDDTLIVSAGTGDLDVSVRIHSTFGNPDTVTGQLTAPNKVKIPEQSMGGGKATAEITLDGDKMSFQQSGMGITCGGTDYARVP